jgi:hypothetical protein
VSRLYIANTTKHDQIIFYRLDFDQSGQPVSQVGKMPKQQTIPRGRQVNIGGDLYMSQIDSIVEQLKPYGLIGVADVQHMTKIAPYVFNVDQPVSSETMRRVHAFNDGVSILDGKKRRQSAAVAVNDQVQRVVDELAAQANVPLPTPFVDPTKPVVEFEQIEQSENGEKRIEEGYILNQDAPAAPEPKGRARRKAA